MYRERGNMYTGVKEYMFDTLISDSIGNPSSTEHLMLIDSSIFWVAIAIIFIILVRSSVVVVRAGHKGVVTVRGNFRTVLSPGFHFTPPLISNTESVRMMQSIEVPTQEAITQDNRPVHATATIDIKILDVEKAFHAPEDNRLYGFTEQGLRKATKNKLSVLAAKELRARLGEMEQEYVLMETNWEEVVAPLARSVNEQTEEWGIRVQYFEITDITVPNSTRSDQTHTGEFESNHSF